MLKLKLQYFGHLMQRADSLEKTLMLGKTEGRRRRGWQRMRWLDSNTDSMDLNLRQLQETVEDRVAWHGAKHGVAKSGTRLSDWTTKSKMGSHWWAHWLIGKDSDAGRDWGQEKKGTTEDEMAGCHYQLDGHEFEWTPGVGDGQGGLACCNSWGCKESDTTERLNWTELNAKAETPILWPPHVKSWLIGKDSDAQRDWEQEEKGTTENEMAGWHHQLDGCKFEWTLGVGDGQGGLACCNSWGLKESDTTEWLNWSKLNWILYE